MSGIREEDWGTSDQYHGHSRVAFIAIRSWPPSSTYPLPHEKKTKSVLKSIMVGTRTRRQHLTSVLCTMQRANGIRFRQMPRTINHLCGSC